MILTARPVIWPQISYTHNTLKSRVNGKQLLYCASRKPEDTPFYIYVYVIYFPLLCFFFGFFARTGVVSGERAERRTRETKRNCWCWCNEGVALGQQVTLVFEKCPRI